MDSIVRSGVVDVLSRSKRWPTCKSLGIPCATCGKVNSCIVSPDRVRFKCWRNGGKVHDTKAVATVGTGYVGKAHQSNPGGDGKGKAYLTAELAARAAC